MIIIILIYKNSVRLLYKQFGFACICKSIYLQWRSPSVIKFLYCINKSWIKTFGESIISDLYLSYLIAKNATVVHDFDQTPINSFTCKFFCERRNLIIFKGISEIIRKDGITDTRILKFKMIYYNVCRTNVFQFELIQEVADLQCKQFFIVFSNIYHNIFCSNLSNSH